MNNPQRCSKQVYGNGRRQRPVEEDVDVARFVVDVVSPNRRVKDLSGGWNEAVCALHGDTETPYCWGRHGNVSPRCECLNGDCQVDGPHRQCYLTERLGRCQDEPNAPDGWVDACLPNPVPFGEIHQRQRGWLDAFEGQDRSIKGLSVGAFSKCMVEQTHEGRSKASCWGFLYNGMTGGYRSTCAENGWSDEMCIEWWIIVPIEIDMPNDTDVQYIDIGTETACAVLESGRVACWGRNDFGQTGSERRLRLGPCVNEACEDIPFLVPVDMDTVVSLSVGGDHVCAVNQRGLLYCWGRNDRDQTGLPSDDEPCADNTPCVRQATQVPNLPPIIDVAAGRSHTCALDNSGHVLCWGDNQKGQLGIGSVGALVPGGEAKTRQPIQVGRLDVITGLAAGEASNCARSTTGRVYCWGDNSLGQLGDGNCTSAVALPMQVDLGL